MFAKSLALRIFVLNLLLIVLPVTIYFLFTIDSDYHERVAIDTRRISNIGHTRASYLDQFIEDQYTALDLITTLMNLTAPGAVDNFEELITPLKLDSIYPSVGFLLHAPDGRFIMKYTSDKSDKNLNRDLTYRGYTQLAAKNGYSVYLGYDDLTLEKEFVICKAIHARDDYKLLGILGLIVPADKILRVLIEDKYFTEQESVSLLTQDKIVFASSKPHFDLTTLVPLSQERIKEIIADKQFGNYFAPLKHLSLEPYSNLENVYQWTENGQTRIAFIAPVSQKALYILTDVDKARISRPYIKATWTIVAVLFSITMTSCVITILISNLLSKTFRELINVMDKVSSGDLNVRFKPSLFGFEINEAGLTLNRTLDQLVIDTKEAEAEQLKTAAVSKELKVGREIQQSILPHNIPDMSTLEIGVFSKPASEVSGDFYDIYMKDEQLIITLAGTSGKGLFSCLYSVCLRSMLKAFAMREHNLSTLLEKTNVLFHQDLQNTPLNIKTFVGAWNDKTQTFSYASASPSFGFVCLADGTFEPLAGSRNSMGVSTQAAFPSYELHLEPDAIVILYTNGIVEQQNPTGLLYGENGLKALITSKHFLGAKELAEAIASDLESFSGGAAQQEDMTIIVLKAKNMGTKTFTPKVTPSNS